MGCVSSRDAKARLLSYQRNISMPIIHASKRRGDSFHIVSLNQDSSGHQNTIKKLDNNQNPPESQTIINSWELMEGVDEETPPPPHNPTNPPILQTSFSFDPHPSNSKKPTSCLQLDPIVISNFRKALTELSPKHTTLLLHRSPVIYRPYEMPRFPGIVKARIAALEEKIDGQRGTFKPLAAAGLMAKSPPGGKWKVVIYTTSLMGVRNTFESCCNARGILHIYRVRIDDRDVSMHGGFRDELNEILGYGYGGAPLPRVFVNGRHMGGAEEVARLHDSGELGGILKDCEMAVAMNGEGGVNCGGCGDYRFLPCGVCSGICKVFVEEKEDKIGGFRRCMNCNENGLVRCHLCC